MFAAHRFDYGGVSLRIQAAAELDPLLTDDAALENPPYWAVLWKSAPALAAWLVDQGSLSGRPVLELGCGAGLVGLCAARLGADVLQTDYRPEGLRLARENARRNGLYSVRHLAADWRHWPLRGTWPLIVASDILYERPSHRALLRILTHSLAPEGEALIADPDRPMTPAFLELARASAWRVESLRPPEPGAVTLHRLYR